MSEFLLTVLLLGCALSPMAIGIFISMKVFNIPDITTDGSYTLGATVTAVLLSKYQVPISVIFCISILSGAIAGSITGFIHTRMKVNALLSGILVMTALYSINLMLLGRSNVPIIGHATVFDAIACFDNESLNQLITLLGLLALLVILMYYALRTDFGIAMRATGNNPFMTKALGINNNSMRIIGLALANACTAWSGFLMTQYQGFADINMGIGIVITGLGSVLIADSLIQRFKIRNLLIQLLLVVGGCMLFEGVLGLSLSLGADPMMLKLITAVFVLMIVGIPGLLSKKLSD